MSVYISTCVFVKTITCMFLCVSQMGYGSRALEILQQYYEGKIPNLSETESQTVQEAPSVDDEVCCCYGWLPRSVPLHIVVVHPASQLSV